MNTSIQLSNPATIRAYFEKVRELQKSGEQFPVDLDNVWPLVYSDKNKAVRALQKECFEGEDFTGLLSQNGKQKQRGGHNEKRYLLTVACMEFFIARKVREVFNVYRAVFHAATSIAPVPMSPAELLLQQAQMLVNHERELAEMKQAQSEHDERIRLIEARTTTKPDYFTIAGFASLNRIQVNVRTAASLGQVASRICRERNLPMDSTPDPRFGTVNMYPRQVLTEVFNKPL